MSTDPDCVFCKIIAGQIPCFKLWEDQLTLSFMDINPGNDGHALVIPKTHAQNLFEVPDTALQAVASTVKRVATAINTTLAPDGLSLMQANGPGAAQSVPHFHVHILPRVNGDNLTFNGPYSPGNLEAIGALAERIKTNL
jgi:histidine triad (HIT) family protein